MDAADNAAQSRRFVTASLISCCFAETLRHRFRFGMRAASEVKGAHSACERHHSSRAHQPQGGPPDLRRRAPRLWAAFAEGCREVLRRAVVTGVFGVQ